MLPSATGLENFFPLLKKRKNSVQKTLRLKSFQKGLRTSYCEFRNIWILEAGELRDGCHSILFAVFC